MKKNNKLLLIDGSSVLSTSFYGLLPKEYRFAKSSEEKEKWLHKIMQTSDGTYTNGVYTMTKTLLKLANKHGFTHICVAWDVSRNTFRKKAFEGYKSHRKETKPELASQFQVMQDLLEEMNIPQFKYDEYEADDIIGTLVKKFEGEMPTYVYTKDRDALQLISEKTRVWLVTDKSKDLLKEYDIDQELFNLPHGIFEYTPELFRAIHELEPIQIIDQKALEGDKSDFIPGCPGVGAKKVLPLLKEFGTVEGIYEAIEGLDKKEEAVMKKFFKEELGIASPINQLLKVDKDDEDALVGKKASMLSKMLATIKCDIEELQDVKSEDLLININDQKMNKKFVELEFNSLLK